ncbi:MAG: hypothetical protein AAGM67_07075 [Bacteroidota bacterium]
MDKGLRGTKIIRQAMEGLKHPPLFMWAALTREGFLSPLELKAAHRVKHDQEELQSLWEEIRKALLNNPRYQAIASYKGSLDDLADLIEEALGKVRSYKTKEDQFFAMSQLDYKIKEAEKMMIQVRRDVNLQDLQSVTKWRRGDSKTVSKARLILSESLPQE